MCSAKKHEQVVEQYIGVECEVRLGNYLALWTEANSHKCTLAHLESSQNLSQVSGV